MSDTGETKRLIVESGDACIVIRKSGEINLAIDTTEPMTQTTLLAIGLATAAENADWCERVIKRTREKIDMEGIR